MTTVDIGVIQRVLPSGGFAGYTLEVFLEGKLTYANVQAGSTAQELAREVIQVLQACENPDLNYYIQLRGGIHHQSICAQEQCPWGISAYAHRYFTAKPSEETARELLSFLQSSQFVSQEKHRLEWTPRPHYLGL